MTFRDAQPGTAVGFGGMTFTVKDHIRGHRPGADVTICSFEHPRLKDPETTFCSDLECAVAETQINYGRGKISEKPEGERLSGDHQSDRGTPVPVGL